MQPNMNGNVMNDIPQATPVNPGSDVVFRDKPKKNTGMIIGMVVLALLAAGGIGFGVWAYLSGNQKEAKLNEQVSNLQNQLAEQQTPVDETVVDIDDESATNAANYIYVGEWGIKIKIPDSLSSVSYKYSQEAGYTKVTVWGVDCSGDKCQYFPDYANANKNTSGMGSITRYPKGATFDAGSAPTLVFSDETYDYYQYHPQLAYTAENPSDEAQWEMDSVNIISDMLSNPENYSKF